MQIRDVLEGLKNNTIKILTNGHMTNPIIDDIEYHLEHNEKFLKELKDKGAKWVGHDKKPIGKESSENLIKFVGKLLEVEVGQRIGDVSVYCFDCGINNSIVLIDENTLALIENTKYYNTYKKSDGVKFEDIKPCECETLRKEKKLTATINVPTGNLIFTNYFKEEKIYSFPKEIKSFHSINSVNGRKELMDYLATQDIGYGQMGNMSVDVFVKNTGDEIIIGGSYGYNEKRGEYVIKHRGYKNLGSISLSVWRWMCGDTDILKAHKEELPKNLKPSKCVEDENYKDYIWAKVKPGKWKIEHYFDFVTDEDDDEKQIYSRLKLVK